MKEKTTSARWIRYSIGMTVLAVGLALTAQTGLGTSPLTSIAFVLAEASGWTFADMTLVMFSVFILGQILLEKEIVIEISMSEGGADACAWGCDLSYDYVKINGDYRT